MNFNPKENQILNPRKSFKSSTSNRNKIIYSLRLFCIPKTKENTLDRLSLKSLVAQKFLTPVVVADDVF